MARYPDRGFDGSISTGAARGVYESAAWFTSARSKGVESTEGDMRHAARAARRVDDGGRTTEDGEHRVRKSTNPTDQPTQMCMTLQRIGQRCRRNANAPSGCSSLLLLFSFPANTKAEGRGRTLSWICHV